MATAFLINGEGVIELVLESSIVAEPATMFMRRKTTINAHRTIIDSDELTEVINDE